MVELRDIEKNYTNFDLKINLKINKGEIFGLIGQSGSGKSTILRIVQGLLKADKGEVNITKNAEIAYIFQEFIICLIMRLSESLKVCLKVN